MNTMYTMCLHRPCSGPDDENIIQSTSAYTLISHLDYVMPFGIGERFAYMSRYGRYNTNSEWMLERLICVTSEKFHSIPMAYMDLMEALDENYYISGDGNIFKND